MLLLLFGLTLLWFCCFVVLVLFWCGLFICLRLLFHATCVFRVYCCVGCCCRSDLLVLMCLFVFFVCVCLLVFFVWFDVRVVVGHVVCVLLRFCVCLFVFAL